MNYPNNPLEDLHRLTEAVKAAHADIAPTYLEYTQLAFAIATDCGEAGRADFMTLCSISPKYDAASAERLFTNALRTHKNSVHLGTAFHLARQYGVEIMPPCSEDQKKCKNAENAKMHPSPFPHTRARNNKVENIAPDDEPDEETEWEGTEPHSPLPTFQQDYKWPAPLDKILSFGKTARNATYSCWERSPCWEPRFHSSSAACTAASGSTPACKPSWWRQPPQAKAYWYGCGSSSSLYTMK